MKKKKKIIVYNSNKKIKYLFIQIQQIQLESIVHKH